MTRSRRPMAITAALTFLCAGSGSPAVAMTVQDYLSIPQTMQDSAEVKQYLTGFRDGLYDFNAILDSAGVRVLCPPAGAPPIDVSELRTRIRSDIEERQARDPDFANFAHDTNLGLTVIEALGALYPCEDEPENGPEAGGGQAK